MTETEIENLNEKGRLSDTTEPRIAEARCEGGRVTLTLKGSAVRGTMISFDAREIPYLADATEAQLGVVELSPNGDALWFPELDEHIAVIGLLERLCGVRSLKANLSKAGATKSAAKSNAARLNGARGGRPRTKSVAT